jgi:hypothetical protein
VDAGDTVTVELLLVIAVLVLGASLWFVTIKWNEARTDLSDAYTELEELRALHYQVCYQVRHSAELREQLILYADDYVAAHQGDYPEDE